MRLNLVWYLTNTCTANFILRACTHIADFNTHTKQFNRIHENARSKNQVQESSANNIEVSFLLIYFNNTTLAFRLKILTIKIPIYLYVYDLLHYQQFSLKLEKRVRREIANNKFELYSDNITLSFARRQLRCPSGTLTLVNFPLA